MGVEKARWLRCETSTRTKDTISYNIAGEPLTSSHEISVDVTVNLFSDDAAQAFITELSELARKYGGVR